MERDGGTKNGTGGTAVKRQRGGGRGEGERRGQGESDSDAVNGDR